MPLQPFAATPKAYSLDIKMKILATSTAKLISASSVRKSFSLFQLL